MTETVDRCIACLDPARHYDANGVCPSCRFIHRSMYAELIALLGANDVHIENDVVLSTGEKHATGH